MTLEFWEELETEQEAYDAELARKRICRFCQYIGLRLIGDIRVCQMNMIPDPYGYCDFWIPDTEGKRLWKFWLWGYGG